MPKGLDLNKVTGIVAVSYLALIPVGAYVVFRAIRELDQDVSTLWNGDVEKGSTRYHLDLHHLRGYFHRRD